MPLKFTTTSAARGRPAGQLKATRRLLTSKSRLGIITGPGIQEKKRPGMDHMGTEMLVLDRPTIPVDSGFDVQPMVLDLSCVPAVILIVEDETMLRMLVVDMVEDAGYTAIEASDADEAIAILESRCDIALMCTDIQMPGSMDGVGLAQAVHVRWPSIKIIVVSGQLKPPSIDLPPCSRFFGKPLEAGQMIAQMRNMIGQA